MNLEQPSVMSHDALPTPTPPGILLHTLTLTKPNTFTSTTTHLIWRVNLFWQTVDHSKDILHIQWNLNAKKTHTHSQRLEAYSLMIMIFIGQDDVVTRVLVSQLI